MRCLPRLLILSMALIGLGLAATAVPTAHAAANHVVISEFASRGPAGAFDEFCEWYNPTNVQVDISGWKLQYSSGSSGTTWSDRATLPSNTVIAPHGYFLIANQTVYTGAAAPDYNAASWTVGLSDNAHLRILDASSAQVDKVGYGTAVSPEGGSDAPSVGTSTTSNSVERKAFATSTADSMFTGGLHALAGNGQDTDVNGSDFVLQTHSRNPQNASSPIEPPLAAGGNGTGLARISPTVVYTNRSLSAITLSVGQDSAYTLTKVAILVPSSWTWSHTVGDVSLAGTAFASASVSLLGDSIFVNNAAVTAVDSGTVTIANLTTPATKGGTTFTTRTAVAAGTLVSILKQPSIRVLDLVPIVSLHVNNASGVCAAPYAVGAEASVTGIVTANLNDTRTDVYVQDASGGVDLFNAALAPITLAPGDSITATGSVTQFRGLLELTIDFSQLVRHAAGRPLPDPMLVTCAGVNATFKPDFTEPNEGRLIRINGVTYNSAASTLTDASGTTNVFIPATFPPTPSQFDIIGILKQFKPGTPAPGPPYTADYEISPRTPDDIIPHAGPVILTTPREDNITPTSVRINWTTDVSSTSVVRYGLTPALGDSAVDNTNTTAHALPVTGLTPATVYYYSAGSADGLGANFSPVAVFSTASPPQSSGAINAYFNKSVTTNAAAWHAANGNADLLAQLLPRLDNAKRSIDASFYNLSGTPGNAIAAALVAAKNRGVKVRVICEYDNSTASGFTALTSGGVPLINDRFDPLNGGLGLMHNKFVSVDSRGGAPESTWVWTGSWNPTDPGTNDDYQNSIEIQDQALANTYTLEFNEMWGSSTDTPNSGVSRFGARKQDNTPHFFVIGGKPVECYFSPSDYVTGKIISLINGAQHSVGFELLTLTRSDISAALISRHNAGVAVRGDLDNNSDSGTEYPALITAGVDVHVKNGGAGLLHHKYCVVDAENPLYNAAVLTGSHNWSSSAENSNNENTVIVRDFDIANQYLQEMAARYYQFGGTDSVRVAVEQIGSGGRAVALAQNFPNPFHGKTGIVYSIPSTQKVELSLFDIQGRELKSLVNTTQAPGRYRVELSAGGLSSGVYFYRLKTGGVVQQKKLLLMH